MHRIITSPLSFGEVGVKARIRNVLSYRQPAFWIIIIALVMTAAAAVFLLTDPVKTESVEAECSDGIEITEIGSSTAKAGLEVEELIIQEDGALKIKYRWENMSQDEYLTYGEMFRLQKKEGGKYVPLSELEGTAWTMIAYSVTPSVLSFTGDRNNEEYISYYFSLPEGGEYRYIKSFTFENEKSSKREEHISWVDFTLTDGAAKRIKSPGYLNIIGKAYYYNSETAPGGCTLVIDEDDKTYRLSLGVLSSYYPMGTYEDKGDRIILKSGEDDEIEYVFIKEGNSLVYDEKASTHSLSGYAPHGARFEGEYSSSK